MSDITRVATPLTACRRPQN